MKKTKKSMWLCGLALVICFTMLLGATFAWFTDSVTNTGNKIEAGNLKINVVGYRLENGAWSKPVYQRQLESQPLFQETTWEPGQYGAILIRVSNYDSTLAAKVNVDFDVEGDLADALWYKLHAVQTKYASHQTAMLNELEFKDKRPASESDGVTDMSKIENDKTEALTLYTEYSKGQYAYYVLEYGMYTSAGNEYQDGSFDLDFTVKATQAPVETDGFGNNDYDKNANANAVFGEDIVNSLKSPGEATVVAGENIDLSNSIFKEPNGNNTFKIPDGKTLDLNGYKFIMPAKGSGNGLSFEEGTVAIVKNGVVSNDSDLTMIDIEYGSNVTFEEVHFVGFGGSQIVLRANGEKGEEQLTTVVFKNCTFTNAPFEVRGMNGKSYIDVQFINCTFTGTYKMYDENGAVAEDPYGHIHYTSYLVSMRDYYLCGNVLFDNCTMDLDASEASYKQEVINIRGGYYTDPGTLKVTLKDVGITGKNVIPVEVDGRDVKYVEIVEQGVNSYTVDGNSVNYDGTAK